jgi:hypothetical protein
MAKPSIIVIAVLALIVACDSKSKDKEKTKPKPVSGCTELHDALYYADRLGITESEAMATVKIDVTGYPDGGHIVDRLEPHTKVHVVEVNEKTGRYQIDAPVEGWILPSDLGPRIPNEKHCAK